ncbi:MAG: hypothetical protein ACLR3C_02675 [Eggerthella lenta]
MKDADGRVVGVEAMKVASVFASRPRRAWCWLWGGYSGSTDMLVFCALRTRT